MSAFNGLRVGKLYDFADRWELAGNLYEDSHGNAETFLTLAIAYGSDGDDRIGISGNLITYGRLGDDTILFSENNDVVSGGGGADTFVFTPHPDFIESNPTNEYFLVGGMSDPPFTPNPTDVITDFRFSEGDKLQFDADMQIVSVEKSFAGPTEAYGVDLGNSPKGTDLKMVLTDGEHTQTLWLLDAWTGSNNAQWVNYLHEFGYWGQIA